jgi:hypothetical protein
MSSTRHLIVSLGFGTGFWVLASFTGAMLDPMRAEPWTMSLMWSLLASAAIAPALLMAYHSARQASARQQRAATGEAKPFVEKEFVEEEAAAEQMTTLWPDPQTREEQPTREHLAAGGHEDSEEWPQTREDVDQMVAA